MATAPSITLDESRFDALEQQARMWLTRPPLWLRFPAELDQRFETHGRPIRWARFQRCLYWTLAAFLALALVDPLIVPDALHAAWSIRMLLVTPAVLFAIRYLDRNPAWREIGTAGLIALMATSQVLIAAMSTSPYVTEYEHSLLIGVLLGNLVSRVRFRIAVPFSAYMLALTTLHQALRLDPTWFSSLLSIINILLVCGISLAVKHTMELDNRVSYANHTLTEIARRRLEMANQRLSEQAIIDPLTGLLNRREMDERLECLHRLAARQEHPVSVLFIDVDHFKAFNDTYGHQAGDDCLRWLSSVLRDHVRRPMDGVARYGGEEFAVLLPDTPPDAAREVAEHIRQAVYDANLPHRGSPFGRVTLSIGVAGGHPSPRTPTDAYMHSADQALYLAKTNGRNCVVLTS